MTTMNERSEFEAWITSPPYERSLEINPEASGFPGQYRAYEVQLAWEAYQAGRAALQSQREPVVINDADILAIAGRVESCPVSPWWLKDDVAIGDVRAAVLRFARALLDAALQSQDRQDRKDALRYRYIRSIVSASNPFGRGSWKFHYDRLPKPLDNPMKGVVAQNFDEAIDHARRAEGDGM